MVISVLARTIVRRLGKRREPSDLSDSDRWGGQVAVPGNGLSSGIRDGTRRAVSAGMLQQHTPSFSRPVDFTDPARRLPSLLSGWFEITAFNRRDADFVVSLAPRPACAPIALCLREQRIIESMLSGRSQKQIGYEFDLSPGTVSAVIRQILHKLGAACWEHLVTVACALGGREGTERHEACLESTEVASLEILATVRPGVLSRLTPAERDIALYVIGGCSNAQIAQLRRTSVRTIANQISSLFRKLAVRGRLELILRMLVDEPAS